MNKSLYGLPNKDTGRSRTEEFSGQSPYADRGTLMRYTSYTGLWEQGQVVPNPVKFYDGKTYLEFAVTKYFDFQRYRVPYTEAGNLYDGMLDITAEQIEGRNHGEDEWVVVGQFDGGRSTLFGYHYGILTINIRKDIYRFKVSDSIETVHISADRAPRVYDLTGGENPDMIAIHGYANTAWMATARSLPEGIIGQPDYEIYIHKATEHLNVSYGDLPIFYYTSGGGWDKWDGSYYNGFGYSNVSNHVAIVPYVGDNNKPINVYDLRMEEASEVPVADSLNIKAVIHDYFYRIWFADYPNYYWKLDYYYDPIADAPSNMGITATGVKIPAATDVLIPLWNSDRVKVGSYVGTGAYGNFVTLGFHPVAMLICEVIHDVGIDAKADLFIGCLTKDKVGYNDKVYFQGLKRDRTFYGKSDGNAIEIGSTGYPNSSGVTHYYIAWG